MNPGGYIFLEDSKNHLQELTSRDIFNQSTLLKALSNVAMDVCKDEASNTSLGSLFLAFTSLCVKNLFLMVGSLG